MLLSNRKKEHGNWKDCAWLFKVTFKYAAGRTQFWECNGGHVAVWGRAALHWVVLTEGLHYDGMMNCGFDSSKIGSFFKCWKTYYWLQYTLNVLWYVIYGLDIIICNTLANILQLIIYVLLLYNGWSNLKMKDIRYPNQF